MLGDMKDAHNAYSSVGPAVREIDDGDGEGETMRGS
jgi:hypothetical protein